MRASQQSSGCQYSYTCPCVCSWTDSRRHERTGFLGGWRPTEAIGRLIWWWAPLMCRRSRRALESWPVRRRWWTPGKHKKNAQFTVQKTHKLKWVYTSTNRACFSTPLSSTTWDYVFMIQRVALSFFKNATYISRAQHQHMTRKKHRFKSEQEIPKTSLNQTFSWLLSAMFAENIALKYGLNDERTSLWQRNSCDSQTMVTSQNWALSRKLRSPESTCRRTQNNMTEIFCPISTIYNSCLY